MRCPSDSGIPSFFVADPTLGGPVYREASLGGYGSSYCLNVVLTRLGLLAALRTSLTAARNPKPSQSDGLKHFDLISQ